jgi:hypothetical protein
MVAAFGSCFDYRAGLTRTIAGSSLPGYVDGAGSSARFASIQSVAWTQAANFLVLVDSGNAIRRIDAMSGETSALAGDVNNACVVRDGLGSEARFCRPKHVRITTDASTVWVLSQDGKLQNISVGSGQVPAAPLQCKAATREECRAYASGNAPWLLPLAETKSCDRPAGCLRAGARDHAQMAMGIPTSVIFNTCPNSTTPPPPADTPDGTGGTVGGRGEGTAAATYGVSHTGSYTPVCAGGMFSPCFDLMSWSNQYPDESSYKYSSDVWRNVDPPQSVLFERSTWRFAAGFAGDEESVAWYRDPQYRRCK